jgi:hypothetical protein
MQGGKLPYKAFALYSCSRRHTVEEAKLTITIPKDLQQKAKAAAAIRGQTLSDVVRSALVEYVKETKQDGYDGKLALESDPLLSLRFTGGPGDVAERVSEILRDAIDPNTGLRSDNDRTR